VAQNAKAGPTTGLCGRSYVVNLLFSYQSALLSNRRKAKFTLQALQSKRFFKE
jgi:hypothetical protein